MKRLSEKDIKEIIDLYSQGATPKDIGLKFGIMNNSVTRILRKRGVERNQLKRLDQSQIDYISQEYANGKSSEAIAKVLGLNGTSVCRVLHRTGTVLRPSEENKRTYKIDQNYFQNIDCEEKAYIIGFLYADANVTEKYSFTISLNSKDEDILEKMSNIIYGHKKIVNFSRTLEDGSIAQYSTLSVYSKKICSDLHNLGCTNKKTFSIRLPKLRQDLMKHFIRGYFDGDGCISLTENKSRVDITSNVNFLSDIKNFISSEINVDFGNIYVNKDNEKIGSIQLSSALKVKTFLDYLYLNSNIHLKRKYNLYLKYLDLIKNKRQKRIDKTQDINNYGTTYIVECDGNVLSYDYLSGLSEGEKEKISEKLVPFYRKWGFPYPTMSVDDIVKEYSLLCQTDPESIIRDGKITLFNSTGSMLVKHFSPHFFEVKSGTEMHKPSVLEAFNNDNLLKKVIYNRLSQDMPLSGNMLRQGIVNSNIGYRASSFNVLSAKYIYNKYAKEGDCIYDYSMGFGQRLLGAMSLPFDVTYIGADPLSKSVKSNQEMFNFLKTNIPNFNKKAILVESGSESFCPQEYLGKVDMAFSSPPYFNLEVFEMDEKQSYFNKKYVDFINIWWRTVVKNISLLLRDGGLFLINIKDWVDGFHLSKDMLGVAHENGFLLEDTLNYQLTKNLAFKNKEGVHKFEPIYVLRKA